MKKLTTFLLLLISTACLAQKQTILTPKGDTITYSPYVAIPTGATSTTYMVKPSEWQLDGSQLAPGTIIYIPAGTRGSFLVKNLKGTPTNPIIIINKGGKVIFNVPITNSYAFKTQNCRYFKVQGNGTDGVTNGFEVIGGNIGVTADDLSSDFEFSNLEVHNQGFAGIMAKTDPTSDPKTQRGNFTLYNPIIHDCNIHDTGGEGIYLGNSFYNGGVNGLLPHDVVGAKVYNNKTYKTGCEGIQVGAGISGTDIYNNAVILPGQSPFASGQSNGIQIGEGTGGKCHDNDVEDAPGNGVIVLGLGDNLVYNNTILRSGENGIFADSRYTPGPSFSFLNNTIVGFKSNGIKLNSTSIPMQYVINNIVVGNGQAFNVTQKVVLSNNFASNDINAVGFIDAANGDYRLKPTSPLYKKGLDVSAYGVKPVLGNQFSIGVVNN